MKSRSEIGYTIYYISLAFASLISIVTSFFLWQKRTSIAINYFAFLLIVIANWSFFAFLEFGSPVISHKIFFSKLIFISRVSIAPIFLFFSIYYSNYFIKNLKYIKIAIMIIPIIILIAVFTNEFHHLIWENITSRNEWRFLIIDYHHGSLIHLHSIYAYTLIFLGMYILTRASLRTNYLIKKKFLILVGAACIPLLANILYMVNLFDSKLDFTPVAFTITGLVLSFILLGKIPFDLIPIARDLLIDRMISGVIVIDNSGRIIDINKSLRAMFGGTIVDYIGKMYNEIIPLVMVPDKNSYELKYQEKYYEINIDPIQIQKIIIGSIIFIRDTTEKIIAEAEKKNLMNELMLQVETKNRFISILSHDLRSPMQGFLGITDLLSSNLEDLSKPEIKEMIESLNQSAKRQSELIEDVLTWSRLTNHNAKMEKEELNLWEEVQNVIMLLYLSTESKNISLNNSIEKDVSVYCDRNMLQLVLRNLISNAIKFSYKGSEVILYNNISEEIVEIIIEDFGVGISSANLNKLFVLGENFSLPGTDQEKGTGFGLILCKEIILNLGGNIEVESILGKGTKFIVQLPRTHKINPIN